MSAPIFIGDGVRVTKNLIVIAVIVLDNDIHKYISSLVGDNDWFGVDYVLVGAKLAHELLNAVSVKESLRFIILPVIH